MPRASVKNKTKLKVVYQFRFKSLIGLLYFMIIVILLFKSLIMVHKSILKSNPVTLFSN